MKNLLKFFSFGKEKETQQSPEFVLSQEQWESFVAGEETPFTINEHTYNLLLLESEASQPNRATALLSTGAGAVIGELDVDLPSWAWSAWHLGYTRGGSMKIFYTALDYLNQEKEKFLHQMNIRKTKENTENSLGKALETDN